MPVSLALCFDAPMQSWGARSRSTVRDTATEPTKSGVIGLLAAALGVPRDDEQSIKTLAALRLGVRVDREGIVERDFQTTRKVPNTSGKGHRTVISDRFYLADALFLVVLEGDPELLSRLYEAVQHPVWPLYFGRRAFVPARPLVAGPKSRAESPLTGAGIVEEPLEAVLGDQTRQGRENAAAHPWLEPSGRTRRAELNQPPETRTRLRTMVDCALADPHAELRHDHPVSFARGNRQFASRTVRYGFVELTTEMIGTEEPACS